MNLQSKFVYCIITQTLIIVFLCKRDGISNGQTDGQTIQLLDVPGGPGA